MAFQAPKDTSRLKLDLGGHSPAVSPLLAEAIGRAYCQAIDDDGDDELNVGRYIPLFEAFQTLLGTFEANGRTG